MIYVCRADVAGEPPPHRLMHSHRSGNLRTHHAVVSCGLWWAAHKSNVENGI